MDYTSLTLAYFLGHPDLTIKRAAMSLLKRMMTLQAPSLSDLDGCDVHGSDMLPCHPCVFQHDHADGKDCGTVDDIPL